jgi:ethanolamine ammonia-lyase small subunit
MPNDLAKPLPTKARLSLGRTATAISTHDQLQFQLNHALARDAVHAQLDIASLAHALQERNLQPVVLRSAIESSHNDRRTYLRRPDLGRKLHPDSAQALRVRMSGAPGLASETWAAATNSSGPTILFILADGLSAQAIEHHALPLLDATFPLIPNPCPLIPLLQNARVAIADEIGQRLHADLTILLIGERPGLSSPDSLGVYITWDPHPGRSDAERNCISNIRGPEGLSYAEAARRIVHYIAEATRLQTTGIALKDPAQTLKLDAQ